MADLKMSCFGQLRIEMDGRLISHFDTEKARALLVYLAVEHEYPQQRSHLAGLLWSDLSEEQAMHSLRQTLSSMRKLFGDKTASLPVLLIHRDSVQINPAVNVWVDVREFRLMLAKAYRHYQNQDKGGWPNVRRLEQALALKQSSFLAQFQLKGSLLFDEWLLLTREDLDQSALEGLALLADIYERRGEYALARDTAQRILNIIPWDESTHTQLMRLFALDRQWGAAINQYRMLRQVLQEELGVEPIRETLRLLEQIRAEAVNEQSVALQKHVERSHLPQVSAALVGRSLEMDEISDLLVDPACRLLTLIGPGGIGKTRLAIEIARQYEGVLKEGVYFVPLETVTTGDQVFIALAEAFDLLLTDQSNPNGRLIDFLREKRMLLVLDNYEQLMNDGQGAQPLADILKQAPGVKLLVTSRELLRLREEWVYPLHGLSYPPDELPEAMPVSQAIDSYDALTLFSRRGRQARHDFVLDDANINDAVKICRALEGLPLGVELAAATMWNESCHSLEEKIAAHFDGLDSTLSNIDSRHRSLRAVFNISWQLLDASEQALFCRLSIFRGGFTSEAAQEVASAAPEMLDALVNQSLLRRASNARFRMHEVIRLYAGEKLNCSDCQFENQEAHARYFLKFLAGLQASLRGKQQKAALDAIQQEIGNARIAWEWGLNAGAFEDLRACLEPLYQFFYMRSRFTEGITLFMPAVKRLEAMAATGSEQVQIDLAMALARIGGLAYCARETKLTFNYLERAFLILGENSHHSELAFCRSLLGGAYLRAKEFLKAQDYAHKNLDYFRRTADLLGECHSLYLLGLINKRLGKMQDAKQYMLATVAAGKKLEERRLLMAPFNLLGDIACVEGDYAEAEALFLESLHIARDIGDIFYQAIVLNNLASVYHVIHDYDKALSTYKESLVICCKIGDRDGEAVALNNLGELALVYGEHARAIQLSERALSIAQQIGEEWTMVVCYNNLGEASYHLGKYEQAMNFITKAIRMAWKIKAIDLVARFAVNAGRVCHLQGRQQEAVKFYRAAVMHPALEHDAREKALCWMGELKMEIPEKKDERILEDALKNLVLKSDLT
jgi:predicted ATPase/DNA-binding SARP family transcriptional activator